LKLLVYKYLWELRPMRNREQLTQQSTAPGPAGPTYGPGTLVSV
jgi:hypothetical protein